MGGLGLAGPPFLRDDLLDFGGLEPGKLMRTYTAVVEKDSETGLFVGYIPGFPGAHSQGATMDELNRNLQEVIEMLLEDGEPELESEFVGVHTVRVA
jgi:predicted RNase H-like HicB family nuclease